MIILFCGICGFITPFIVKSQTSPSIFNYGIWQGFGTPLDKTKTPEIKGRLCNVNWKDLEVSENIWVWDSLDIDLTDRAKDSLPIIFMVYTEAGAPGWIYDIGVPKVPQTDPNNQLISYAPFYADSLYRSLFKRMITTVRQHIETLPDSIRKWIIGVQGCYGSTGDYIGYKGTVPLQYALTGEDFYNLFTEFSSHVYNEYSTTNPKIYLLSNPQNNGSDQMNWLIQNCPNSWIKCGSLGKGFQLNDELDKASWLYNLLNFRQNGEYIRSRSELQGNPSDFGWWREYKYRNMFALMNYCIFWGLDWSNQSPAQLMDTNYDASFEFYNKYAGQKDPAKATNALCALKDGLDASDTIRFPQNIYGLANRADTNRYKKIVTRFTKYGARLEDPQSATLSENTNLIATGINDVGWNVFPGNYERYLHQIAANETSIGYWNINAPADSNAIYGKFGRGFNNATGKNALYFDIDSAFLNTNTLPGYPVVIDITYLDAGTGSFRLYYDSKTLTDKKSILTTCKNSGTWKKTSVTLYDFSFKNRASHGADFYIMSGNSQNVLFSIVEVSRPNLTNPQTGLSATDSLRFDTVCTNATQIKSFGLTGSFLNGTAVTVKPLPGYAYAFSADSVFKDSLIINNYGTGFTKTIYVKFNPLKKITYAGAIFISGGGSKNISVKTKGVGLNSRPFLNAAISNITCFNAKNGSIDLILNGGTGPFTYSWKADSLPFFQAVTEDISSLVPAVYNVTVTSAANCTVTKYFTVTTPALLTAVTTKDSDIVCKGGTTTVTVTAAGGTLPYQGTGVFTTGIGNISNIVTDAHGCAAESEKVPVLNGTLIAPSKPLSLTGNDGGGVCNGGTFIYRADTVTTATAYTWTLPPGTSLLKKNLAGNGIYLVIPANFTTGVISVTADNVCGSSFPVSKNISNIPDKPDSISGPTSVLAGQVGLLYKVVSPQSVTYTWAASSGIITAGQGTWSSTITWGLLSGKVNVKAGNSCGVSPAIAIDVNIIPLVSKTSTVAVAAQDLVVDDAVGIMPNPVHDIMQLVFTAKEASRYTIEIKDLTGKILLSSIYTGYKGTNRQQFNLQSYSKGIYFITIISHNGNRHTLKVLKV